MHLSAVENTEAESSDEEAVHRVLSICMVIPVVLGFLAVIEVILSDIGSVPTESLISIPSPMLAEMIRKTILCDLQEDNRYIYNASAFVRENKLTSLYRRSPFMRL